MKTLILAAALTVLLAPTGSWASRGPIVGGVYTDGDARLQPIAARSHTCTARSPVAVGYWTSTSLAVARHRALVQCAARTPRAFRCYIASCS